VDQCSEIINRGSGKSEVYRLRAMAYRAMGNYDNAASDYIQALKNGKKDAQTYIDIAMVHICQHAFDKAEAELTEATRLMREMRPTDKNNYLLESMGRVNHYMGNYRDAINNFRDAIENGSHMALIDIMSSLFRAEDFLSLRNYSDSLMREFQETGGGILSDSTLYYYTRTMNDLSKNAPGPKTALFIDRAIQNYRPADNHCFQGFYYDLLATKAYIQSQAGDDSSAYDSYKKLFQANGLQVDLRAKLTILKTRLKMDVNPPSIIIKNPILDNKGVAILSTKTSYEIYGQVRDSTGISAVYVNNQPVRKIEEDGLFAFMLELQAGKNEVVIAAVDNNENRTETSFVINNVTAQELPVDDLDALPLLLAKVRYHALLIAENDYQDESLGNLTSPVLQATELKELLMKNYLFEEKDIMVIKNAKRLEILDSIEKKCNSLGPDDNLLIYYAGHGTVRKVGSTITGGFLIPADGINQKYNTMLSSTDLQQAMSGSAVRHILFVADACFGGALFRSGMDEAPKNIKASYQPQSRKIMTSGNLEEVKDDSKFFQCLKKFLTLNTEKYVSAVELFGFVKKNAEGSSPQYDAIKEIGHEGGEFIFIHR
jgi:tetratricopeptide (TPR) repeat protein